MFKNTFKTLLLLISISILAACGDVTPVTEPHGIGSKTAPVLVEEFSDLQCPACASISPKLEEVVRNNSDIARFEYRHFPLSFHEHAFRAAEASECAADQDKFFEYIAVVFENQPNIAEENLFSFAEDLGLNKEQFSVCMNERQKRNQVTADLREGQKRNVGATPTIFVNGLVIRWSGAENFEAYIKDIAEQLQNQPL